MQEMEEESMRRKLSVLVAGVAVVAAVTTTALAVTPGETPFPSPTIVSLFVTTNTFTGPGSALGEGVMTSRYPLGSTVVFKVFAADAKTKAVLTAGDVTYAYIKIPGQPNIKLSYVAPTVRNGTNFTGTWTIPSTMPTGIVQFVTRFQSKQKTFGNFVQIPVETAQLTVTK
jgi:hypothetical protein